MTMKSTDLLPGEKEFAICTYILQSYAGLTFNEATTYLWVYHFNLGEATVNKSRQAIYSIKKKALKKINECKAPVLEMIKPYVESAPYLWVD